MKILREQASREIFRALGKRTELTQTEHLFNLRLRSGWSSLWELLHILQYSNRLPPFPLNLPLSSLTSYDSYNIFCNDLNFSPGGSEPTYNVQFTT